MEKKLSVQPTVLSMSECQGLFDGSSKDIEELTRPSGCFSLPGERVNVPVPAALNMLVLSIGKSHGVEIQAMAGWLPGLRNEALLKLGEDTSNWSFQGTSEEGKEFWPKLYGLRETIGPHVARLLGCSLAVTTRQLRFYSQSDVIFLSNSQFELGYHDRAPRFTIDSHALAAKIRAVCSGPLFSAKVLNLA